MAARRRPLSERHGTKKKLDDQSLDTLYGELHTSGKVHKNVSYTFNFNASGPTPAGSAGSIGVIRNAIIGLDFEDALHVWSGQLLVPSDRSNFSGPFFVAHGAKPHRRRTALASLVLLAACSAPPYAVAWAKTGNPVFPFLNEKFRSPLLPAGAEIRDSRFHRPLAWRTPYDLTFHTSLYYEGRRGSFGFQQLFFAALAIVAALVVRRRAVVAGAGIALGAALLILSSEPNVRYLYPELPLLVIPFAALLGWAGERQRLLSRALLAVAVAAAVLNIWFIASGSYWHRDLYGPFTSAQREQYLKVTAPLRTTFAWFERTHPGAPVLLTNDTAIAGLSGPVYENQWHQYRNMLRIRNAPDAAALRRILDEWNVRFVIARHGNVAQLPRPQTLRDLIAQCGTAEFSRTNFMFRAWRPAAPAPRARHAACRRSR